MSKGVVIVEGRGEEFAWQDLFDVVTDGGCAGDASDGFHGIHVVEGGSRDG
jgi:hypothetical protein